MAGNGRSRPNGTGADEFTEATVDALSLLGPRGDVPRPAKRERPPGTKGAAGAVRTDGHDASPLRASTPRASAPVRGNTPRRNRSPHARRTPAPRYPTPRLTGLGSGLFSATLMTALGLLVSLLVGDSTTVYAVLYLPVCLLTALWTRRGDLVSAPVVLPIAFAVGIVFVTDDGDGVGATLMGLVTALATQAGWLYGGTLAALVVVAVRRFRPRPTDRHPAPPGR
ncbi:DUF6542 domain-containing protein [Streptomyces acidiscabies]|uniref:DUF6542 domain-containing protein n=1 Tax=Streptomyces acidiscabies TaxID=42234 RepID=UPI0038F647BE